ncbi:MAG: hypothetical protein KAJ15_02865 [Spirochaetes bacterium]|nr:hypothetical protein [Spirochaetota bacterium]
MKVKTIKRHIITITDTEAKLIYRALMLYEKQNDFKSYGSKEIVTEMRECFYDLVKPGEHIKNEVRNKSHQD